MFDKDFLNKLDDFRFLDLNIGLAETQNPLLNHLLRLVQSNLATKRFHDGKYRVAMSVLLANLLAKNIRLNYSFLAIPFNNNYYSKGRYNPFGVGVDIIRNIRESLKESDLITTHIGFLDTRNKLPKGKVTRFGITEKLVKLFQEFEMLDAEIITHSKKETILLKDKKGNLIDYLDDDETNRMRSNLNLINAQIGSSFNDIFVTDEQFSKLQDFLRIAEDKTPIDFNDQTLVRVFNNGSFDEGGRFYRGWWQIVPHNKNNFKLRDHIRIDDYPTREFDYQALHPTLLYIKAGLGIPKNDAYTVEGFEKYRKDLFKPIFNAMLNAKRRKQFIQSSSLNDKVTNSGFEGTLEDIVLLLEEKHKPIKKFFFSGIGLRLQREDSDLAEEIMLRCLSDNITVLPVHDSMISRLAYSQFIEEEMINCFEKKYGLTPKLSSNNHKEESQSQVSNPANMWNEFVSYIEDYSLYKSRLAKWEKIHH